MIARNTSAGLFSVLVDGDDMNEPVADAVRSILDEHIVLSRQLASANHYPAIDVLQSVSRVMPDVVDENASAASAIRDVLATYREAEDLINIGAYVSGSNPRVDLAFSKIEGMRHFLRQGIYETSGYEQSVQSLMSVA